MNREITDAGVYEMSDAAYQADPCVDLSLRSGDAFKLVALTPAHVAYGNPRLNADFVREEKPAFDIGKVAHSLLLGKGADFAIVHHDDYRKAAAREEKQEIRAAGKVPLKPAQAAQVRAMAKAARQQIQQLIDAGTIEKSPFDAVNTERVIVWRDRGVLCRAMLDGLSVDGDVVSEYKTEGQSAALDQWQWKARKMGYIFRLAFYRRGLEALKIAYSPHIAFFVQETEPPYLLAYHRVDDELIAMEDERVRKALAIWRRCVERNEWPGYSPEGFTLVLTQREEMARFAREHANEPRGGHVDSDTIAREL